MKNKEQKIVRLLDEGFSYETIKKMSNLHINKIYESLDEVESYNTKTKVFDLDDEIDRKELDKDANSGGDKQITATDQGDVAITMKNESEISEDDDLAKEVEEPRFNPYAGNSPGNTEGPAGNNPSPDSDGMGIAEEEINEDEVLEALFGKPKKKMKPITTLGMFESKKEKYNPWAVCTSSLGLEGKKREDYTKDESNKFERCVKDVKKQEQKEEKVRQIEENILSLIKKSQGKVITKKDLLSEEPSIAPVKPKVKPGVRPERGTPYKPKHSPKPKAGTEVKPARPTVKPGVRPERGTPYKPKHSPKPKAGGEQDLPEFLKFNNLNIKFRDE